MVTGVSLQVIAGGDLVHDGGRAGGLAHDRYLVRVAAEKANVLFHPSQSESLIEQSGIGCSSGRSKIGTGEPAKWTDSVVERNLICRLKHMR